MSAEERALQRRRERVEALRSGKTWERRGCSFTVTGAELRSDEGDEGPLRFTGYASLTEVPYTVGGFTETIRRGAFKRTLNENPDVVFRIEHSGLPLARTARAGSPGTLHLEETDRGLFARAEFDRADPDAQRLKLKMDRGLVDEMSFAFRCTDDDWNGDMTERTVKSVTLHGGDVSVVTFGASPSTGDTTSIRAREARAYAAHELAELGAKGQAFSNPDGHWSFPTATRGDLEAAIHAVGRSGASHDAVRKYLMARAKAMGLSHLIPINWASDGSARAQAWVNLDAAAQELQVRRAASRPPRLRAVETELDETEPCPVCAGTGKVKSGTTTCGVCGGTGSISSPDREPPPRLRPRRSALRRPLTRSQELALLTGRLR